MGYFSDLVDAPATQDQPSLFSPFQAAADRVRQAQMPVGGRRESLPQPIRDFNGQPISDRAPDDYLNDLKDPETRAQLVEKIAPLAMSMTPGPSKGIKAYHGSPYDFDRFDLNKIGTGEGAQSYGHGLYFAENEGVAKVYRDALRPGSGVSPTDSAARILQMHGGDAEAARAMLRQRMDAAMAQGDTNGLAELRAINGQLYAPEHLTGRMYEVNINAHPDQFLDWDKALPLDHPARDAASQAIKSPGLFTREPERTLRRASREDLATDPELSGADLYSALSRRLNGRGEASDAQAASVLQEAGVPGIKYLDAGSRAAGDGSRNYVVFNDQLIDILRKYGILGPAAVGAASGIPRGEDD